MKTGDYVQISEQYFKDNPNLKEFIYNKEERRMYIGVVVKLSEKLNMCIPFRTNMPNNDRVREHGIFAIPSKTRPDACLDLTKSLVINDETYLTILEKKSVAIPAVQKNKINENIDGISRMLEQYIKGYKKDHKQNIRRAEKRKDPLYQYSTLQNYHRELGLQDKQREQARRLAYLRQQGRER